MAPANPSDRERLQVPGALAAIALAFLALSPRSAYAQVEFEYSSSISPSIITPVSATPHSQFVQTGVGDINNPTGPIYGASPFFYTNIVVASTSVVDLGTGDDYVDTYGPTPITVSIRIRDVDSGATGLFTFSGTLTGTVAGSIQGLAASFSNPFTATSESEAIGGGGIFVVSIDPSRSFAGPGSPPLGGTGLPGAYTFEVQNFLPEPSAAFIGILAVAALQRRRLNFGRG